MKIELLQDILLLWNDKHTYILRNDFCFKKIFFLGCFNDFNEFTCTDDVVHMNILVDNFDSAEDGGDSVSSASNS